MKRLFELVFEFGLIVYKSMDKVRLIRLELFRGLLFEEDDEFFSEDEFESLDYSSEELLWSVLLEDSFEWLELSDSELELLSSSDASPELSGEINS